MIINTQMQISITDAEKNFRKVTELVDKNGSAVILKNNRPRYIIMEYADAEELVTATDDDANAQSDRLIDKYLEAYKELAK